MAIGRYETRTFGGEEYSPLDSMHDRMFSDEGQQSTEAEREELVGELVAVVDHPKYGVTGAVSGSTRRSLMRYAEAVQAYGDRFAPFRIDAVEGNTVYISRVVD